MRWLDGKLTSAGRDGAATRAPLPAAACAQAAPAASVARIAINAVRTGSIILPSSIPFVSGQVHIPEDRPADSRVPCRLLPVWRSGRRAPCLISGATDSTE